MNIKLRKKILDIAYQTKTGHIGGCLSVIDMLYICYLKLREEGEQVILSKGHAALALYVCLNELGKISDEELSSFYKDGTKLPAHPSSFHFKEDIPFGLGSLGHGLPLSCGVAYANKLKSNNLRTYIIMSDGETNEGTTWEAAHFAVANKLDKLIVFIDKNKIQAFGKVEDVLGDTASKIKWESIGFDVFEINGNCQSEIEESVKNLDLNNKKPKLIIGNTIKGKGVSFMENIVDWHYLPMTEEHYKKAIEDLDFYA